jgi:hypothetical protein
MSYLKAVLIMAVLLGFWVATEQAWRVVFGNRERRAGCGGCTGCGNRCSETGLEKKRE